MLPIGLYFRSFVLTLVVLSFAAGQDWAGLNHYKEANEKIGIPSSDEQRIVFMGNSITQSWATVSPDFFAQKGFVCRGISGQTTPQMLVRFRSDVLDLEPSLVILLAGTNDIAENTGPITFESILRNIISMTELARANGIPVILASVLPAKGFSWRPDLCPAEKIVALNNMIKAYADTNGYIYLDYYTSMADNEGGLKSAFTRDGVHPSKAGYEHMALLANAAIKIALSTK